MEQDSVCVREPIKIYARFENPGTEVARIFTVDQLGANMRYMFLEVRHPKHGIEWRSFQFLSIQAPLIPTLAGEAILPGSATEVILYPHMTQQIGPPEASFAHGRTRFTFDAPGRYTVRVAYVVPDGYEVLWKPSGGILFSEPFEVVVLRPTKAESEILDAVWSGDIFFTLLGDDLSHLQGPKEDTLRDVIARYGSIDLVRHAIFTLGRMIVYDKDRERAAEGLQLLADVTSHYPAFRSEESRLHRANGMKMIGEFDEALAEYQAALERYPELVDNYNFMTRKLNLECRCSDGFRRWQDARAEGTKLRNLSDPSE